MGKIYWIGLPLMAESIRMRKLESTYYRDALEKDLTDIFFEELQIRANAKMNIIISCYGPQRYGKCLNKDMLILTPHGYVPIKDLHIGDEIVGLNSVGIPTVGHVLEKFENYSLSMKIVFDNSSVVCSPEHKFLTNFGWRGAKDLNSDTDILYIDTHVPKKPTMGEKRNSKINNSLEKRKEYERDIRNLRKNKKVNTTQNFRDRFEEKYRICHKKRCLEKEIKKIGTGLFGRDNRWGGFNNNSIKLWVEEKRDPINAFSNHFQHKQGFNRLANGGILLRDLQGFKEISKIRNIGTVLHQRYNTIGNNLESGISLFDNQKETGRNYARIFKSEKDKEIWDTLFTRRNKVVLGNKKVKSQPVGISEVSRQSKKKTRMFDITTTLGNYICNGIVVHNSWAIIFIVMKYAEFAGRKIIQDFWTFTVTDCLKAVGKASPHDIIGLDEQVHLASYGSMIERRALNNIEMVVGKMGLSFFFIAPVYIPHAYHYLLEVWQMGAGKKWDFSVPIEKQWKYTKLIVYDHQRTMLGYIVTKTPENKKFLEEYEIRKDKFIDETRELRAGGRYKIIGEKAFELVRGEYDTKKINFFQEFIRSPTKRLKELLTREVLKGYMMSTDESKTLVDRCEVLMHFDPEFKDKTQKLITEFKEEKREFKKRLKEEKKKK